MFVRFTTGNLILTNNEKDISSNFSLKSFCSEKSAGQIKEKPQFKKINLKRASKVIYG